MMALSTPVGFIVFNRPDLTERVFAAIANAKPRKLLVVADGPRTPEEAVKCDKTREIIQRVTWDCEVLTNFSDRNLGCGEREATGFDWIFSQVEEAILLEDDTLPCPSFFTFCESMLERYRDDRRIMHINGDNSVNPDRTSDSYYFSKYVHGWGWASWRRAWKHYDFGMRSWPAFKKEGWIEQVFDDQYEQSYWTSIFEQMYEDPRVIDTWDYQWIYACWSQGGLAIAPNKNLVSNIGFNRPDAAHTLGDDPRSNLLTSEIKDIRHPKFVVVHKEADQHSFNHIFGGQELRREEEPTKKPSPKIAKQLSLSVLHINASDVTGGAAIAGHRLHKGLIGQGINSRILVGEAKSEDSLISCVPPKGRLDSLLHHVTSPLGLNYLNIVSSFKITTHNFFEDADILNFHNLHYDYFNYAAIYSLTRGKPAVYTLHDMWGFTGHCAYSNDCARWQTGCGECPYPSAYPEIKRDNTRLEWKLKKWIYHNSDLTIVAPSNWMVEQVKKSMLGELAIHRIPYGIDTDLYCPLDSDTCRTKLGIPKNKYVLMFGAETASDPRKGADLLASALKKLPKPLKSEVVTITMGWEAEEISKSFGIYNFSLGYITDEHLKAVAYSAADLFVFPTRNDNLPLVLLESMSCGTPMVSFNVGGVPDLVRPNITGYLAASGDASDLANGIAFLLENTALRERMHQNCRKIALQEYALSIQAGRYIGLYQHLLARSMGQDS